MACKRCELACAVEHSESKDLYLATSEKNRPQSRVEVGMRGDMNVPLQCRHCENAQCVSICPTGAMRRLGQDGPVVIERELCVGCSFCVVVCHFGVPRLNREGKALIKCDLCIERLERDELPACVVACPTRALTFVEFEKPADVLSFVDRFAPKAV